MRGWNTVSRSGGVRRHCPGAPSRRMMKAARQPADVMRTVMKAENPIEHSSAESVRAQFDTLAAMAGDLAGHFALEPLLERILRHTLELLGCDNGSICTVDEAAGKLPQRGRPRRRVSVGPGLPARRGCDRRGRTGARHGDLRRVLAGARRAHRRTGTVAAARDDRRAHPVERHDHRRLRALQPRSRASLHARGCCAAGTFRRPRRDRHHERPPARGGRAARPRGRRGR